MADRYAIRRTIGTICEHEDCRAPATDTVVLAQDMEDETQIHIGFFCRSHALMLTALLEEDASSHAEQPN